MTPKSPVSLDKAYSEFVSQLVGLLEQARRNSARSVNAIMKRSGMAAGKSVTDSYSKLRDDADFRKQVAEKVRTPSENAVVGSNGPKIEVGPFEELAVNC